MLCIFFRLWAFDMGIHLQVFCAAHSSKVMTDRVLLSTTSSKLVYAWLAIAWVFMVVWPAIGKSFCEEIIWQAALPTAMAALAGYIFCTLCNNAASIQPSARAKLCSFDCESTMLNRVKNPLKH